MLPFDCDYEIFHNYFIFIFEIYKWSIYPLIVPIKYRFLLVADRGYGIIVVGGLDVL